MLHIHHSLKKHVFSIGLVLLLGLILNSNLTHAQPENSTPPVYKDGMEAFMQFIAKKIKYPQDASVLCISGRVFVQFKVTEQGTLDSIQVVHSIYSSLDKEAIRVVKLSENDWIPARRNDTAYGVKVTMPIRFTLSNAGCKDVHYFYDQGVHYFEKGNFEKAIENFNEAIRLDLWHVDALYNCAISHLKLHQFDAACIRLEQYKARGMNDADELIEMFCKAE